MTGEKRNLPASVAARLLHRARQSGDDFQVVLTNFCLERFLYRLGVSEVRERFVLKGALLLRLWSDRPYRATRDLDLLRKGDGSFDAVRHDIRTICATEVPSDAVEFDPGAIRIETIRAQDEYAGARATLPTRCGTARLALQIDLGLGDEVWPAPQPCRYPALLDFPAPEVLAYPREAVIAEKLEAMVVLGERNSRIKDFFDLHYLAEQFDFDRATLSEAVRKTFARRSTPIPADEPVGLTPSYWQNPARSTQLRAFARRAGLAVPNEPDEDFVNLLASFVQPIFEDLHRGDPRPGKWRPGGPWE